MCFQDLQLQVVDIIRFDPLSQFENLLAWLELRLDRLPVKERFAIFRNVKLDDSWIGIVGMPTTQTKRTIVTLRWFFKD